MKPCKKCGGVDRYVDGACKACACAKAKEYRDNLKATDPDKYRMQNRIRTGRDAAKKQLLGIARNLSLYGITQDDWQRMFEAQRGACYMCGKPQSELKYRLAVDHCHTTGKVRALLCPKCNNAVAAYENYKDKIEQYLEAFK